MPAHTQLSDMLVRILRALQEPWDGPPLVLFGVVLPSLSQIAFIYAFAFTWYALRVRQLDARRRALPGPYSKQTVLPFVALTLEKPGTESPTTGGDAVLSLPAPAILPREIPSSTRLGTVFPVFNLSQSADERTPLLTRENRILLNDENV